MRLLRPLGLAVLLAVFGVACLTWHGGWLGASPTSSIRVVLGIVPEVSDEPDGFQVRPALGFLPDPRPRLETLPSPLPAPVPKPPLPAVTTQSTPALWPDQPRIPSNLPSALPFAAEELSQSDAFPRFWADGEYLMAWIRDSHVPPLVTGGPQSSQGILGQPGTVVLYGNEIDHDVFSGGRFTAGAWLDPVCGRGLEGSFFFLGQRSVSYTAGSGGDPLYARPYFSATGGVEAAEPVANVGRPGVDPFLGRVSVSSMSRLWGLEASAVGRPGVCIGGVDLRLLSGFRFVKFDEALVVDEDLRAANGAAVPLGGVPIGHLLLADDFATRNEFYGGQVGALARWARNRWTLDLMTKVALGLTHESVAIQGATLLDSPGGPRTFGTGLLAGPGNVGRYHRDRFGVLPEAGVTGGWQVTSNLRATLGYSFLYWNRVARPGDQIDRVVNATGIPPGNLIGPVRPAFTFGDSSFWVHTLAIGLELTY